MATPEPRRRLSLTFAHGAGGTGLARLHQESPLRALFPRPSAGDLPEAVLVTTSGGLVGGDRLAIEIEARAGAAALITAQAAEKIYRSAGPVVDVAIALDAGADTWLEWLPQETILFDGARLRRQTVVRLDPSARFLGADMVVFGRTAHGEHLTTGALNDGWRVHRGGRLAWADTFRLTGDLQATLQAPFALAGARAMATLIHAGADAGAWLDDTRAHLTTLPGHWGASALPGLLVVRGLDRDAGALRTGLGGLIAHLRHAIQGLPERLPTSWWS